MEVKYHLKYQYDSLVTKTDNEPGVQKTKRVIESSIFVEFLTSSRESGENVFRLSVRVSIERCRGQTKLPGNFFVTQRTRKNCSHYRPPKLQVSYDYQINLTLGSILCQVNICNSNSSACWLAVMRSRYSDFVHALHSLEQGMKPVLGHTGVR